ncbi:MAG: ornithine carbamoyltransferase [Spirochaetia bacterium]|nr:ornithine carbamoyltransferase [Spirochaetia bacterium]
MRHLVELTSLSKTDFYKIVERGARHRSDRRLSPAALSDRSVALLFEKSSTRTRLSFSIAVSELGGNPISLDAGTTQMGRGESIEDTTEVLARYAHAVMIRAISHTTVQTMAHLNRIPILNGLTDLHHPCQALADWMTIFQYKQPEGADLKVAFVGEGNNVFHSLAHGALFTGAEVRLACPEGYGAESVVIEALRAAGIPVMITHDPAEAVRGANVVYTDTWVSMGQEAEEAVRRHVFRPYSLSLDLLKHAAPNHMVMHCLPAHRGEELDDDVMKRYGRQIFDQAENRLHVQKALLEWIFELI